VVQLAATIYGSIELSANDYCSVNGSLFVLIAVVASWLDLASAFAFALFVLSLANFMGSDPLKRNTWYENNVPRLFYAVGLVTCGIFGTPSNSRHVSAPAGIWYQISTMVAQYIGELEGLVLSDILAAIVLLRVEQRQRERLAVAQLRDEATESRVLSSHGSPSIDRAQRSQQQRKRGPLETLLLGPSVREKPSSVRLKVQALASATPVSPRGSWISHQLSLQGRVAAPEEHLDARVALEDATAFVPYMLAIYGWKLHFYMNPLSSLCRILGAPALRSSTAATGDNALGMAGRTFKMVAGVSDDNVVYASFTSYLGEAVPYVVSVDHDKRAVVISCRGTLSVSDLITDLHCEPKSLEAAGRQWGFDGKGAYAHSGMLKVAMRLRADIESSRVLHKLYTTSMKSPAPPRDLQPDEDMITEGKWFMTHHEMSRFDVVNYRLVVIGHSLGGGIGAILSLLLRPSFPEVHCIAYSPPGCIFDLELAKRSEAWVSSVFPGKDVVPRLSWHSMKNLRAQMVNMLRRCKVDKWTAIGAYNMDDTSELLYDEHKVPLEPHRTQLATRLTAMANEPQTVLDQVRMYLPGKILYLVKTYSEVDHARACCCVPYSKHTPHYAPFWVSDRAEFQEVLVSVRMLLDHFPDCGARIIQEAHAFEREQHQGFSGNPSFAGGGAPRKGFVLGHSLPPDDVEV